MNNVMLRLSIVEQRLSVLERDLHEQEVHMTTQPKLTVKVNDRQTTDNKQVRERIRAVS